MLPQLEANNVRVIGIGTFPRSSSLLFQTCTVEKECNKWSSIMKFGHGFKVISAATCAGLEKFGLEEFEEKKYWKSELYIDNGKKIHNALALTKVGWVGTFMMLFANKSVKEAAEKTKDTPGNFQGDGRYILHPGFLLHTWRKYYEVYVCLTPVIRDRSVQRGSWLRFFHYGMLSEWIQDLVLTFYTQSERRCLMAIKVA